MAMRTYTMFTSIFIETDRDGQRTEGLSEIENIYHMGWQVVSRV